MINIGELPKEVQDIIELKEQTDGTFHRFVEEEYSEIFWNMLSDRADPNKEHSFIASVSGGQGCHLKGTQITTKTGLKNIEDIKAGDLVWAKNSWKPCIPIVKGVQKTLNIKLQCGVELNLTPDHVMNTNRGWLPAEELTVNDFFIKGCSPNIFDDEDIMGENALICKISKGLINPLDLRISSINEGVEGEVFDLHVKDIHEYLANGVVSHNSGKSYLAIALCCFLDPNFSADNIYFSYNDLVYDRHKIKPNSAILVDEQSQSFGIDSHRVMSILSSLKEQLRKKSIHFIFCAPTLYDESKSSMYLIETMFIDYENEEAYAALKTRDGLTLGHIKVPSPTKEFSPGKSLATPQLMKEYQEKKDHHLERLLGRRDVDIIEDRAEKVIESETFKRAEKVYKSTMGYIPQGMCVQIINKVFPEFNSSIIASEIAGRIKFNKETSGEWQVYGQKKPAKTAKKKATKKKVRR